MRKIAVFVNSMGGGGAERVVSVLLPFLNRDYQVHLIVLCLDFAYRVPDGIEVFALSKANKLGYIHKTFGMLFFAKKLASYVKSNSIEVVVSFTYRPNAVNILSKTIFRVDFKAVVSERSNPDMTNVLNKFIVKRAYNRADKVIVNSMGCGKLLAHKYKVNRDILECIHNPVSDGPRVFRNKLPKNILLITTGRLITSKSIQTLIYSLEFLPDSISLAILGEGPEKTRLEKIVKELSLNDRVEFRGFTSNIYSELNSADIFVFASEYEGFPNAILEAMHNGLPVVSTDCDFGPEELLGEPFYSGDFVCSNFKIRKYGILVPKKDSIAFADAIYFLLRNVDQYRRLSNASIEKSRIFSTEKIYSQFSEIINRLLEN